MSRVALSRMKNGCDEIPVAAWKGFREEGMGFNARGMRHGSEKGAGEEV